MDFLDIFALDGLKWVYDRVQQRHGTAVALLVTLVLTAAVLGLCVALIVHLI